MPGRRPARPARSRSHGAAREVGQWGSVPAGRSASGGARGRAEVNQSLLEELQERADAAGVRILEARVTDLSYAAEVAEAMLRRQQAAAIVAGRRKIVEGAVGMVRQALSALERGTDEHDAVPLDRDRRASFAANLLTVIASDSPTIPVVNVGAAQ
ncbi:SPFH domain-containing protein [Mycobacterium sp. WMMD1722]|uniref:SPFH domain-containing protein n=1 Tax=Mycobacterium sp. WMMD1722 TaxID=3404117 RepID=UPI003BF49900